jgi:hypothetical protein
MKPMRNLLLALLSMGVAGPAAAWISDSEQPGSVLVFPKYRTGVQTTTDQGVVPNTEFEISVRCPLNSDGTKFDCSTVRDFPNVRLKGHWVCEGDRGPEQAGICHESDFVVSTTVNGTLYLTTEPLADPTTGLPAFNVNQVNGRYTSIPRPPCDAFPEVSADCTSGCTFQNEAYLIMWAIDPDGNPIKFDGLVGDALLREGQNERENVLETYNAITIQAVEWLTTGDQTGADNGGALAFDGSHYKQVTGTMTATVRYPGRTFATPAAKLANTSTGRIRTKLSLLTLDVRSNRQNDVTYVDFNFYNEGETPHSAATNFVCYKTRDLDGSSGDSDPIDPFLNNAFGRKGLVVSGPAQRLDGTPVSLIGLLEVFEVPSGTGAQPPRAYATPLYHDGTPVTTIFFPDGVFVPGGF